MVKTFLVKNFPSVGKFKRYFVALKDSISPVRYSYSQHSEDAYIWQMLQKHDLEGSIYVDIGANHPTDISNTYLLYRNGLRGIIIEPNAELILLFKKFRKADIALTIGCSNRTAVLPFNISKTPVISSFNTLKDVNTFKKVYLPVMPVDNALKQFVPGYISLLSIDVEGLNMEVLEGGKETIMKSLIICVEYESPEERNGIIDLLGEDFEFLHSFGCNLLFLNNNLSQKKLKSP